MYIPYPFYPFGFSYNSFLFLPLGIKFKKKIEKLATVLATLPKVFFS